jgi:hypothetical protein
MNLTANDLFNWLTSDIGLAYISAAAVCIVVMVVADFLSEL